MLIQYHRFVFRPAPLLPLSSFLRRSRILRISAALGRSRKAVGIQEAIETAAGVLEGQLFFPAKELHANGFKHSGVHEGLAKPDSFEAGHVAGAEMDVLHEMAENHVDSIGAGKAVSVYSQVLPVTPDLHLRP